MRRFILFTFLKGVGLFFLYMPHCLRFNFASFIAFLLFKFEKRRKSDLFANLDFAYDGVLSEAKKQEIAKANYLNVVYGVIGILILGVSSKEQVLKNIHFNQLDIVEDLLEKDAHIVFVTAHFGAWEYAAPAFACRFNRPILVIARNIPYLLINEYLMHIRSRFNIQVLDKKGSLSSLIKALRRDKVVGIVTDQNTSEKEGELVNFFGKKVRHTPIASILSRKFDAKIIHAFTYYSKDYKKILVDILPPIAHEKSENIHDDIYCLTQIQSEILEKTVRESPEQWLWFHRKFKNQY
ncbi:MAG: lipid A biosynthesis acyltransferase, partial [Helicobacter sp.]|nr:lipid A biosynthesis acyltransferase [Helicobacter sp.]